MHSAWPTALSRIMQQAGKGGVETQTNVSYHLTNQEQTQPEGELLLGLLTLLTMDCANAATQSAQKQPYALKQPYSDLAQP